MTVSLSGRRLSLVRPGARSLLVAMFALGSLLAACGGPGSTPSPRTEASLTVSIRSGIGGVKYTSSPQPGIITILRQGRQVRMVHVGAGRKRTVSVLAGTYEITARLPKWPTASCDPVTVTVTLARPTSASPHCMLAPAVGKA